MAYQLRRTRFHEPRHHLYELIIFLACNNLLVLLNYVESMCNQIVLVIGFNGSGPTSENLLANTFISVMLFDSGLSIAFQRDFEALELQVTAIGD